MLQPRIVRGHGYLLGDGDHLVLPTLDTPLQDLTSLSNTYLDFRPLVPPTHHLHQLRVYLRNSKDLGIPFYTGLVGLLLYFHKGHTLKSMCLQGRCCVTLETNEQLDLFPENNPAHFQLCLPEMWSLDETWEVRLFQFLLPHTWHNVLVHQVGLHLYYEKQNPDVQVFL